MKRFKVLLFKANVIVVKVATKLDVTPAICYHLVGKEHTPAHRKTVGLCIMAFGVWFSKIHVSISLLELAPDLVGYAMHGIGLLPFCQSAEKVAAKHAEKHTKQEPSEVE